MKKKTMCYLILSFPIYYLFLFEVPKWR